MKIPRLLLVFCLFIPLIVTNWAAGGDASELGRQVNRLVRQLDEGLARRNAAKSELLSLGPRILDLLPADSSRLSSQQRSTLADIRSKLQVAAAEATTKASLVTLNGEMTLAEAFSAIERQTGNRISGAPVRGETVRLALERVPFWQALDQLLDQAKLEVVRGNEPGLEVAARPAEQQPRVGSASYDGVFRFEILQVTAVRSLRTPYVNALRVSLGIAWEPRAAVISLGIPAAKVAAVDDLGNSLVDGERRATLAAEVDGLTMVDLTLPFRLPTREAKQIKSLTGQLDATVLGRNQEFTFSRLSETKEEKQSKAGATVTFEALRKNQELYEVRMRVRYEDAGDSLASHRDWISRNKAYIVDSKGNAVLPAAEESFLRADNQVGRAYLFDLENGPDGCRFVYETPGAVVRKSFQFQFEDIDLP